jgi:hypothetical protein
MLVLCAVWYQLASPENAALAQPLVLHAERTADALLNAFRMEPAMLRRLEAEVLAAATHQLLPQPAHAQAAGAGASRGGASSSSRKNAFRLHPHQAHSVRLLADRFTPPAAAAGAPDAPDALVPLSGQALVATVTDEAGVQHPLFHSFVTGQTFGVSATGIT